MDKVKGVTTKNLTWDSIILKWNAVEGASFYQIEADGSKSWYESKKSALLRRGLFPDTEYAFRVRAVKGSSVSEWSDVVKGKTLKAPEFSECIWKEYPEGVDSDLKYSVDEKNPRIVTRDSDFYTKLRGPRPTSWGYSLALGNSPIPLNTVTRWNVKILKSRRNYKDLFVGVVPAGTNQIDEHISGWFFGYGCSKFLYELLNDYDPNPVDKTYDDVPCEPTGGVISVTMDTTKGTLSFAVDGKNVNGMIEGIPLDNALVPCVALGYPGESVEIDPSGAPADPRDFRKYDPSVSTGFGFGGGMGMGMGMNPTFNSQPGMGMGMNTFNSQPGMGMGMGMNPTFNSQPGMGMVMGMNPTFNSQPGTGMVMGMNPTFNPQPGMGMVMGMNPTFNSQPGMGMGMNTFNSQPGMGMGMGMNPTFNSQPGMGMGMNTFNPQHPSF